MNISEMVRGGISVVRLSGRFDANSCGKVEEFLREQIEKGMDRFILDMEGVQFIASAGLRVVLVIAKELRKEYKGDLRLANLQQNVNKVFDISGLNNVLRIFDDVDSALESFES